MKKRLLSIITALALCLTLCPIGAFATGDTPSAPTEALTKEKLAGIIGVDLSTEYVEYLNEDEGIEYSANPVTAPVKANLTFQYMKDGTTAFYLPPANDSGIEVTVDARWYAGRSPDVNAEPLTERPKNVGDYTLRTFVALRAEIEASDGSTTEYSKTFETTIMSFKIKPKVITPKLRTDITKPYDGTSAFVPQREGDSPIDYRASGILEDDDSKVSFTGSFTYDFPDVDKATKMTAVNVQMEDTSGNYYTEKEGNWFAELTPVDATITQASPAQLATEKRTIILRNRQEKDYTFDLENLCPKPSFGNYGGTVTYNLLPATDIHYPDFFGGAADPVANSKIEIKDGKLILHVSNAAHSGRRDVGRINIRIDSSNFESYTLEILLVGDDKTGVVISGLEPVSPPYDGTPLLGYAGRPEYSLAEGATGTELPEYEASQLDHSYVGIHGTDYGPTEEPPTEPGTYEVTLSIPSSDGDFAGSWTRQFTITRAIVTVTAIERRIKVDDPVPSLSRPELEVDYSVTGLAEGDVLRQAPTMKYATVADSISAGEFQILIDGAMVPDEDHYNPAIKYVPGKLIVTSLSDKDDNPFSDVSEYAWYVTAVKYVYNEGLMKGTTNTLFSPTSSLTRGMLVTILYRMEGEPKVWSTNPFKDVDEDEYYYDPIRWANSEGIVQGYGNGRFGPNDALTREHLAIILYKYSRYNAINVNKAASLDRFVDAAHLSAEGYRALQWACAEKLIQGTGSTTLSPNDKALRAQVAVILMRYRTTVAPPPAKPEETPSEA